MDPQNIEIQENISENEKDKKGIDEEEETTEKKKDHEASNKPIMWYGGRQVLRGNGRNLQEYETRSCRGDLEKVVPKDEESTEEDSSECAHLLRAELSEKDEENKEEDDFQELVELPSDDEMWYGRRQVAIVVDRQNIQIAEQGSCIGDLEKVVSKNEKSTKEDSSEYSSDKGYDEKTKETKEEKVDVNDHEDVCVKDKL